MASAQGKACASANAHAGASIFLSAGVCANANASASALLPPCPWYWRGLHPGTLEFQDPVSGVACARLGPRFRVFWRQTAWPLCTSARSAVVLEGCHSMVTFTVTNTYDVCSRDFWRQTAWPLCTSARSTVVFEGCHSMVTLAVTNAGGVCSRGFWNRLNNLSALRLALLSWLPSR